MILFNTIGWSAASVDKLTFPHESKLKSDFTSLFGMERNVSVFQT